MPPLDDDCIDLIPIVVAYVLPLEIPGRQRFRTLHIEYEEICCLSLDERAERLSLPAGVGRAAWPHLPNSRRHQTRNHSRAPHAGNFLPRQLRGTPVAGQWNGNGQLPRFPTLFGSDNTRADGCS
jgi:hypothetical protein